MMTSSSRGTSRCPEIRKIHVKVHYTDVRYIAVSPTVLFDDLVERVREKFAMTRRFKIKVKDEDMPEGDMITMGDQDDLEMVLSSSKTLAQRQRQDVAKMEVSNLIFSSFFRVMY